MTREEQKFVDSLTTRERNGVNYFMATRGISDREAYAVMKCEEKIEPVHEKPESVHETPECVHEKQEPVHVPPPADPKKTEPFVPTECQCRYCGKHYRTGKCHKHTEYCFNCVKMGFHFLNMEFGSTNGWDKKPIRRVPVKDGWRGTVVQGCTRKTAKAEY